MAFKSIGQKYGFVSAGDVRRKMVADAEAKAAAKATEDKLNTAKKMVRPSGSTFPKKRFSENSFLDSALQHHKRAPQRGAVCGYTTLTFFNLKAFFQSFMQRIKE